MSRRIIYSVALATALSLVAALPVAATGMKPWIEVRSPHFRVLTDGSVADGRRVATDFENMRYVFATQFPGYRLESGTPLLVIAPSNYFSASQVVRSMTHSGGDSIAGLYFHGWDKQYAMARLDTLEDTGEAVMFHEYTHSILHTNLHWLPAWLDEGLAEFYGYTQFRQHRIIIGSPTARYAYIEHGVPIPLEELIDMSPYPLTDEDRVEMFYGESWAFVHFMNFGPGMDGGAKLNQFFQLLQTGVDQKKAFVQVFGSFRSMDLTLFSYMKEHLFSVGAILAPADMPDSDFSSQTLSVAETEAEIAGCQLLAGDFKGATNLIEQALHDDPTLGLAHEENGFVLFEEGKTADASDEFSKAFALNSTLYLSLFAKTMLSPIATSDAPADERALRTALMVVLQVDPQFAPAYIQLGRLALRVGNLNEALRLSLKAEELEPWRAGYHIETGQILLRMGRDADAAALAQYVASRWSSSDRNEAVELWNEVPANQRPSGAAPTEEAPKNTQELEGTLKSIDCGDLWNSKNTVKYWTVVLDHAGQTLTFHEKGDDDGFSDTLWYGEDHFDGCHNLEGSRAVVYYRAPSDSSYSGDLAEVDIRVDLPAPPGTRNSPTASTSPAVPATVPPTGPAAGP
jgi:tetratricopeptide (TPR) repeat protein